MDKNNTYSVGDFFKTGIFFSELNIDLDELSKFCYSYDKDFRKKSNLSGIQSNDLDLNLPILRPLISDIYEISNHIAKSTYKLNKELIISNMWFNINKYKDANATHIHAFSVLSGVFYVKTPKNCGDLVFMNPMKISHFIEDYNFSEFNNYNSTSNSITPKENILIIFPSWLEHFVRPNMSENDRISFSFNLNFKR
jgi:uncharacterized protein (TIGR02466 family)